MERNCFVEATDTVLISDILYFAWNKLKCLPQKDVAAICHSFYTDENYVFDQKKKFYDAVGESCTSRKK